MKNRMREIRQEKGISISELARNVEVSERHLLFIESGDKNPSLKIAIRIAKELDTTLENIFLE